LIRPRHARVNFGAILSAPTAFENSSAGVTGESKFLGAVFEQQQPIFHSIAAFALFQTRRSSKHHPNNNNTVSKNTHFFVDAAAAAATICLLC